MTRLCLHCGRGSVLEEYVPRELQKCTVCGTVQAVATDDGNMMMTRVLHEYPAAFEPIYKTLIAYSSGFHEAALKGKAHPEEGSVDDSSEDIVEELMDPKIKRSQGTLFEVRVYFLYRLGNALFASRHTRATSVDLERLCGEMIMAEFLSLLGDSDPEAIVENRYNKYVDVGKAAWKEDPPTPLASWHSILDWCLRYAQDQRPIKFENEPLVITGGWLGLKTGLFIAESSFMMPYEYALRRVFDEAKDLRAMDREEISKRLGEALRAFRDSKEP